jgi:hypothetical protein
MFENKTKRKQAKKKRKNFFHEIKQKKIIVNFIF